MMRSGNPALSDKIFQSERSLSGSDVMTLQGTVNKTFILLTLVFATSIFSWNSIREIIAIGAPGGTSLMLWPIVGAIGGLIFALITIFKKKWAPFTAPIYALLEGLMLGAISAIYEQQFQGIVFQAVMLTFGICLSLLFLYKSRIIKVTENFKLGVVAATGGIFIVYLISFVMSFFGSQMSFIHDASPIGIGFSLFVCVIASLNLVLDFDFIETASDRGNTPKYMEWYGAFALLVTLIWLYLEILRLLSKLNSRK